MRYATGALGALLLAMPAYAEETEAVPTWAISGNVSFTSEYYVRGLRQTLGDGAPQATVTLSHESGFYASVFGSGVDFGDGETDVEVDLIGGYAVDLGEDTALDVAIVYYYYPNQPDGAEYNYLEGIAVVTHNIGDVTLSGRFGFSSDFFAASGTAYWISAGAEVPFADWLSGSANVGYQWIEDNATAGVEDYAHYDVGLTASYSAVSLDLRVTGTDIEGKDDSVFGTIGFDF